MKALFVILAFVSAISCVSRSLPDGVLGREKMENLMTDLLMAESFTENYLLIDSSKTRDEWFTEELNKVLDINDVTQEQFRRSLDYYKARPDQFKVIVDSMHNRAQRNREKIFDINKKKRLEYE